MGLVCKSTRTFFLAFDVGMGIKFLWSRQRICMRETRVMNRIFFHITLLNIYPKAQTENGKKEILCSQLILLFLTLFQCLSLVDNSY